MQKIKIILIVAVLFAGTSSVLAQVGRPAADTMRRYYTRLANSKNEADKLLLQTRLYELLKSNKEQDWSTAASFFYQTKRSVADSIWKVLPVKFPLGVAARNAAADTTIFKVEEGAIKEAAYKAWIKKFPPKNFSNDDQMWYDYARASVAKTYAKEGNVKKAFEYANMIERSAYKGEGYAGAAEEFVKKGNYADALILYKKARDTAYTFIHERRNEYGAGFAAGGVVAYNNHIAEILAKQKKYKEALPYVREAHDSSKQVQGNINTNYATILAALGKNEEAFAIVNETVKAGQSTEEIKELLKTLYVKVKGSNDGYDEYIAELDRQLEEKVRQELLGKIINMPAPSFTLKDVDGNTVSLANYKGKTVVLDFWATWCGPCKKSFPAMSKAMAKYSQDTTVKFLFIHTMEREDPDKATFSAKKYVIDNKFPFEVLMDIVNKETGINNVAKDYKVQGIPTKFIIDKNGNIRFKILGFNGTDESVVHEVVTMIELANKK